MLPYELLVTDNVGNTFTAASGNVAQIPDITPPTFVAASTNVAGTQLAISMSENLDGTATTPASAFTVTYNGVVQPTPSGITVSGSTVTLDLVHPPNNSQVVQVRYSQPSASGDRMRDHAAPTKNETANFGPVAVVNNTPDSVAPRITSASANGVDDHARVRRRLGRGGSGRQRLHGHVRRDAPHGHRGRDERQPDHADDRARSREQRQRRRSATPYLPLNALHDATGNNTALFTFAAANQTPAVVPPASGGGGSGVAVGAPAFISSAPDDGSTVRLVSTVTLAANESVSWKDVSVTRPDGSVTQLADGAGQSATWSFATTGEGLYVVRGTISADGQTSDVLSHFTIWTPPATGPSAPPAVQKNGFAFAAGEAQSADAQTTITWPAGAFSDSVVVEIAPKPASTLPSLPKNADVVKVSAFMRSTHAPVTELGGIVDVRFSNASQGANPGYSPDGSAWRDIAQLPTLNLPDGQQDGWFRDSDGSIHVLTRHLSYYALVGQEVSTKLAMRIMTARRLWLHNRTFVAVRMELSAPARVTGNFVAPDGAVVPGQTIKTPTRRAGVTILRVPLRVTRTGIYRLQMHAEGAGQVVNRTAKLNFMPSKPASPVWQNGALRVAVIRGTRGLGSLAGRLGKHFVVRRTSDAELYDVLDTRYGTAAAAIVVDLGTVPTYTLAEMHALLPEVQIVGLTSTPAKAAYYRRIGVSALLPRAASAAQVAHAVASATR